MHTLIFGKTFVSKLMADGLLKEFANLEHYARDVRDGSRIKRLYQFYGDDGIEYTYDRERHIAMPWKDGYLKTLKNNVSRSS